MGKSIKAFGLGAALTAMTATSAFAADYVPLKPVAGKGQPVPGGFSFQTQYSPTGEQALTMYNYVLIPLITAITIFVLFLLLIVIAR
ncbi:hypothetical protein ABTM96_19310, partial [Acinetobacter baumannii]